MFEQKDISNIRFSRHAKRRMKLYGISEEDVLNVLRSGKRELSEDGKILFREPVNGKFKYPLKVIAAHSDKGLVIVSAYPFKKRRRNESKLR